MRGLEGRPQLQYHLAGSEKKAAHTHTRWWYSVIRWPASKAIVRTSLWGHQGTKCTIAWCRVADHVEGRLAKWFMTCSHNIINILLKQMNKKYEHALKSKKEIYFKKICGKQF